MNIFNPFNKRLISIAGLPTLLLLTYSCATQETRQAQDSIDAQKMTSSKPVIAETNTKPGDPINKIYLDSEGKMAGRGSPDRPASAVFRMGRGVHPKALSMPGLPKDKFGLIDWTSMVNEKIINPVGSLQPGQAETPLLDLNVLIKTKGDFVHNVMFRHKPHVYWLDCKNCHDGIFLMGRGQNKMSMQEIVKGKWCGRCHGKVSFPLTDCKRCHSEAKP